VRWLRAKAWLVALLAVTGAAATFQGGGGFEQNAHYALVRALAGGTLTIDRARIQTGALGTGDIVRHNGHIYSNKPPGMPLLALPAFAALDAVGIETAGNPSRTLWVIGLFGVVLPFFVILVLVRWMAERFERGWGTATAVMLGLGTSLLPFAALFWAHMLSACLLFACFALLVRERAGPASLWLVAGAGALAGYAFGTEIQAASSGLVLGVFALVRRPILSRGAVFGAGALLGALPFLAYTYAVWGRLAFSWVGRMDPVARAGTRHKGVDHVRPDGLGVPSPHSAWDILFSTRGIFVVTPAVACGLVGLVLLIRSRHRVEGIVCACVVGIQIALAAGYYTSSESAPFGGYEITSRYLIPTLPFFGVAAVKTLRRWPFATGGLFAVSAAIMAAVTVSYPGAGYDGRWLQRIQNGTFAPLGWLGVPDWRSAVPFLVFVTVALLATWWTLPPIEATPRALLAGVVALGGWALFALVDRTPWPGLSLAFVNGLDAFAVLALACAALLGAGALYARRAGGTV
jgi:hypothetical protein